MQVRTGKEEVVCEAAAMTLNATSASTVKESAKQNPRRAV